MGTNAGYRPQLDGIRAFAVVIVVLFHLGFTWIPGGFVGVDVFFVLSGYLITGLLVDEATTSGTIRLRRFYARRSRRLLPASILVLVGVAVVAGPLFDAVQRQDLGWDLTWSALYSANWHFAAGGGDYFAPGDIPSPLVHFWSLAVEEQFYLAWPALTFVLVRGARRLRPRDPLGAVIAMVAGLATASAAAGVVLAGTPLTYYGTHTRAYQLLAGGLLALAIRRWPSLRALGARRPRLGLAAVPALGVLGLLAHRIPDATRYPGWPGLAVTAATVVLLAALDLAPTAWPARAAGLAPLAAVGRLSYSLYIWHWPVIVLLPLVVQDRWPDATWLTGRPGMVAVTTALALTSYFLVERPVRFHLWPSAPPLRVAGVGITASLVVALVTFGVFQPRDPFRQQALRAVRDLAKPGACPYFAEDWPTDATDAEPCLYRDGSGPTIAFVGDSHAQQWQPALERLAARDDARLIRATRGGCPANDVVAVARNEAGRIEADTACAAWRRHVFGEVVARYDPDVILVATRSHVRGLRVDGRDVAPSDPDHLRLWTQGWTWTLDTLSAQGAQVVVSEIPPTLPERVPACLIEHGEGTSACDFPVDGDADVVPYDEAIRALADPVAGVTVVDLTPLSCPDGICPAMVDGIIVHRDDNHLSATWVRHRADAFADVLRAAGVDL